VPPSGSFVRGTSLRNVCRLHGSSSRSIWRTDLTLPSSTLTDLFSLFVSTRFTPREADESKSQAVVFPDLLRSNHTRGVRQARAGPDAPREAAISRPRRGYSRPTPVLDDPIGDRNAKTHLRRHIAAFSGHDRMLHEIALLNRIRPWRHWRADPSPCVDRAAHPNLPGPVDPLSRPTIRTNVQ
jgi:hypothetical protein